MVCMVGSTTTWCNAEVVSEDVRLAGTEIPGGGVRGTLYLTLHCHHQKDSCIKMCSRESHFNVSLTVGGGGKVKRQCLQLYKLQLSDEKGEPNLNRSPAYKANALQLGRTSSLYMNRYGKMRLK